MIVRVEAIAACGVRLRGWAAQHWAMLVLLVVLGYFTVESVEAGLSSHKDEKAIAAFVRSDADLRAQQSQDSAVKAAYWHGLAMCPTMKCVRAFILSVADTRSEASVRDAKFSARWLALADEIHP